MENGLNILIVDDHPVVSQYLADRLTKQFYQSKVTITQTIGEAKSQLDQIFDLAILDDELPDGYGTELVPLIRKYKQVPIVFYTGFTEYIRVKRILDQDPTAVIIKNEDNDKTLDAIVRAKEGHLYFSPEVEEFRKSDSKNKFFQLSKSEADIIPLLANGLTVKALSRKLFISEKGVEKRISRLYEKFHIKQKSIEHGISPRETLLQTLRELGLL